MRKYKLGYFKLKRRPRYRPWKRIKWNKIDEEYEDLKRRRGLLYGKEERILNRKRNKEV